LVHSETCPRLGMADIILQFKKKTTFGSVVTANVDSKATAEDLLVLANQNGWIK